MGVFQMLTFIIILLDYVIFVSSSSSNGEVIPPSKHLELHHVVYKPPEFTMKTDILGRKTVLIGFNYTKADLYDRYLFRIRYHGHEEYATSLKTLDRTNENSLKIREMLDANYIICVTLFSSIRSNKYPPISTTGMCADFTIGEHHPIGGSHSSTGLLAPLLFAVAAILLFFISIITYFKRKKWIENIAKRAQRILMMKRNRDNFDNFVAINMDGKSNTNKILNEKNEKQVKWTSLPSMSSESPITKETVSFCNPAFISDDGTDFNSEESLKEFYAHEGALSSIKSLSHLLDEKPWMFHSTTTSSKFLNKSNSQKAFY